MTPRFTPARRRPRATPSARGAGPRPALVLIAAAAAVVLATGRPSAAPPEMAGRQPPPAQQQPPGQQQPPVQPQRPTQVPSFRGGIDVVSLSVTVTDPDGRYMTDLTPDTLAVYEDGVRQDLFFFDHTNLPMALALLLDTSASMDEKMTTAQEAAIGFARRLRPHDQAALFDFDTGVDILQPFTNSVGDLEQAIRRTTSGGSTALYNAIYISLAELKRLQARQAEIRRQAIVLLSDGDDTSSLVTFDQVLDIAKRSETVIYAIGLRTKDSVREAGRKEFKGFNEAEFVLRELTQQTGGRVFFTERADELSSVYAQISEELSSQYLIGYISKNTRRDGAWRRVVVRVNSPNATARTKQGYYAPIATR
jgi:Ca-activated chloride channel family protein